MAQEDVGVAAAVVVVAIAVPAAVNAVVVAIAVPVAVNAAVVAIAVPVAEVQLHLQQMVAVATAGKAPVDAAANVAVAEAVRVAALVVKEIARKMRQQF